MFRHKGDKRTYEHNLKLASSLSLVAGIVNTTGLLSVKTLTTNVTGHFAYFSEGLVSKNYGSSMIYLVFILAFLSGAFIAGLIIETVALVQESISFVIPIVIEILTLITIGCIKHPEHSMELSACALLFAMGLQNSLVTKISNSVVRTTHLTGLFTDFGIELSQLFFFKRGIVRQELSKNIWLKMAIIACFFTGCVVGGQFYQLLALRTLFIAGGILLMVLVYDSK